MRRAGGFRAAFIGPDGQEIASEEGKLRGVPKDPPDWVDLIADVESSGREGTYTLRIEGTVDLLFQARQLSRFVAAAKDSVFEPEIKGPWD